MRIHLRFLRKSGALPEALANDGWRLHWEHDGSLTAHHPLVANEQAGRTRLQSLGLLTTSVARIEFDRRTDV